MSELTITEHNVETGEIITRVLTNKEIKEMESEKIKSEKSRQEAEAAKAAAEAKLAKLGLTSDDLKALGF